MACTTRRVPLWKGDPAPKTAKKIGIGSVYPGCLCSINAAGYLVNGTDTASTKCAGIADGGGTASSNGQFEVDVFPAGVTKLKNSVAQPVTQAHVGQHCFIEDNETVASTSTNKVRAGIVEAVDSDGVWVSVRAEAVRENLYGGQALAAPVTTAGGGAWTDVCSASVTLPETGAIVASASFDIVAAAAAALTAKARIQIGTSDGQEVNFYIVDNAKKVVGSAHHFATGVAAGAVTVNKATLTAIGLQI